MKTMDDRQITKIWKHHMLEMDYVGVLENPMIEPQVATGIRCIVAALLTIAEAIIQERD